MILGFKCETCVLQDKCRVPKMLKPFSDEAKRPLGITLSMTSCDTYKKKANATVEEATEE